MKNKNQSKILTASLIALSVLLVGCGDNNGDSSAVATEAQIDLVEASVVSSASKFSGGSNLRSGSDFSFPEIVEQDGAITMTIPNGKVPVFPARRTVLSGSGPVVEFGDAVTLKYDMFSWSTGELVESSSQYEEAHIVKGGNSDNYPIPDYLAKSLLGRSLGDTIQVVLPAGTEDLPDYLDITDAYVLVVELL